MNILGIFDRMNAPAFPFALTQMFLPLRLSYAPDVVGQQANLRMQLVDAADTEIVALQGVFAIPPLVEKGIELGTVNQIVGLSGLTFVAPGAFRFRVFLNEMEQEPIHMFVQDATGAPHGE